MRLLTFSAAMASHSLRDSSRPAPIAIYPGFINRYEDGKI